MSVHNGDKEAKPGPTPELLPIEGDWEKAASRALRKKRPEEGWPNPEEMMEIDESDNHTDSTEEKEIR